MRSCHESFHFSCDFAIQHRESAFWPVSGAEVKHIYTRGLLTMTICNIFMRESTEFHFIFLFILVCVLLDKSNSFA